MLRAEDALVDGERAPEQRFGLRVASLRGPEAAERGEGHRDLGMVRPERALGDAEGAAEQGLRLAVAAPRLVCGGQEPEAQGHPRVLRPAGPLRALQRGREEALGLGVAALLVGAVARRHGCLPALSVGGGLGRGGRGGQQDRERSEGVAHG